jgi:integrase
MSRDNWGQGRVFRPKGTQRWYAEYWNGGKRIREKTGSRKKSVAQALLIQRLGQLAAGVLPEPHARKTTLDTLLGLVQTDYKINGHRSLKRMKEIAADLKAYFGGTTPVVQITETRIDAYVQARLDDQKAKATVNRALGLLRRAFRLGHRKRLVQAPLAITLLDESDNVRQGFFEPAEIEAVLANLPPALAAVAWFGYLTGWRRGEILTLTWADVVWEGRVIRLLPEHSKNKSARVLTLEGELEALITQCLAARHVTDRRGQDALATHVFHRQGKPIKEFRGAWRTACAKAGVPGRLFHDLRRTAVRNMERAGVPRSVAMKITGHKTEAIYRRYAIVNEQDLRDALQRMDAHRAAMAGTRGAVVPLAGPRRERRTDNRPKTG